MILDQPPGEAEPADVVIAGAGAMGLAMAVRLARHGQRVLVVEAGEEAVHTDYPARNRETAIQIGPRDHAGSVHGRYRGLGGTTRLWGGQVMPFTETDLRADPAQGKPGWPITAQALSDSVDRALAFLGVAPDWASVETRWQAVSSQPIALAPDLAITPSLWLPQPDFARLWAADLASASGPRVLVGHEVVGLDCDPESGRVIGLKLRSREGALSVVRGRACVLACGTLDLSRLLLRCAAALPMSSLAANTHVGRWFFDHLHGVIGEVRPRNHRAFGQLFDSVYDRGGKLYPKLRLSDRVVARKSLAHCAGTFGGALSPGQALRELRALTGRILGGNSGRKQALGDGLRTAALVLPLAWRYLRDQRSATFLGKTATFGCELEQRPSANSYLALEPGVPAEHARIAVHWALDGAEVASLDRLGLAARAWCRAAGLGELELDPRVGRRDPALLSLFHDANHQMGGARMATSARDGVVDASGAVFGMPGLFVAGAATFASGSFANPTLTALALAIRLADRLAGQAIGG